MHIPIRALSGSMSKAYVRWLAHLPRIGGGSCPPDARQLYCHFTYLNLTWMLWDILVATIPSDKGSHVPPMPPTVDLRTKSVTGPDGYWVSDFFISSQGSFILSLYHHLHVFTWLCKNWSTVPEPRQEIGVTLRNNWLQRKYLNFLPQYLGLLAREK